MNLNNIKDFDIKDRKIIIAAAAAGLIVVIVAVFIIFSVVNGNKKNGDIKDVYGENYTEENVDEATNIVDEDIEVESEAEKYNNEAEVDEIDINENSSNSSNDKKDNDKQDNSSEQKDTATSNNNSGSANSNSAGIKEVENVILEDGSVIVMPSQDSEVGVNDNNNSSNDNSNSNQNNKKDGVIELPFVPVNK